MVTANNETTVTEIKGNEYELVFIASPELAEDALEGVVNNISQFITSRGGEVDSIDRWGKRKLAYPIHHALEGFYFLFKLRMEPSLSRELEKSLLITDGVLRHLLVRQED